MRIAVPKETCPDERRVALVPHGVEQLRKLGFEITVEEGAGAAAGFSDAQYREAGAELSKDAAGLMRDADIILQVRGYGSNPAAGDADLEPAHSGQVWIGLHDPLWDPARVQALGQRGPAVLTLETIPRISRAQSMDVLSSMATIAGYEAVLLAASRCAKMFPMMMTAAGTVAASRVLVIGAGVAGLQAIATARRLGAVVQGYDVRPAAAEQIRSLGAKSVELDLQLEQAEDAGGYAKAQGEEFNRRQQEELAKVVAESDVVITTAAIPGVQSPLLITRAAVEAMHPGAVVVDLAAERGGNCELTVADQEVSCNGVIVLGPTDLASHSPQHASQMFSNNLTTLLKHLAPEGELQFDDSDEITRDTLAVRGDEVLHPRMRAKLGLEPLKPPEPTDDSGKEA